jgi:hypothetical protein
VKGETTGSVIGVTEDQWALKVLILDDDGDELEVRVWRNSMKDHARALQPGDAVKVAGRTKSPASKKDPTNTRRFTRFEADRLEVVPTSKAKHREEAAAASDDDGDLAF